MLPIVFERYRGEIDSALRSALAGYDSPLYRMVHYHLGWADENGNDLQGSTGKALRPTLCLLACEATGGSYRQALPAAAAVELVHNFSLVHDDIQDGDRERRHRPTVWSIWGMAQGINAGTALRVLASLAMLRPADGVPPDKQLRGLRLLDASCLRLIEGQYLDISFESRLDVGVADYLRMIDGKTASLIACSLELGALFGAGDADACRALREFGRHVGLAFQIRDDVLGIWGAPEKTGKPVGSDIRRKKKTLPVILALERAGDDARQELASIYRREAVDDVALSAVLSILAGAGAREQAQRLGDDYCARAIRELDALALTPATRQSLVEMAQFLARREF